jgi:hypothetical protein
MTAEEALALLDSLLPGHQLKDIQELVFRYVLTSHGMIYDAM